MIRTILFLGFFACEGPAGPAGVDGIDGTDGLDGSAAERLVHRVTFSQYDNTDDGLVAGRALTFDKALDDTWLRLTYFDSFGCYSGTENDACLCVWEVLFNDSSCKKDGPIEGYVSSIVEDTLSSRTLAGWCKTTDDGKIGAGQVDIEVQISATGGCDAYTGFDDVVGFLEAEEIY